MDYLISLTVISIVSAWVCIAAPADRGISKYIAVISSFAIAIVILMPLCKDIGSLNFELTDITDQQQSSDYNELAAKSLAYSIGASVESKFCMKPKHIRVKTKNREEFEVEYVEIVITDNKAEKKNEIEVYMSELYNCQIVVCGEENEK